MSRHRAEILHPLIFSLLLVPCRVTAQEIGTGDGPCQELPLSERGPGGFCRNAPVVLKTKSHQLPFKGGVSDTRQFQPDETLDSVVLVRLGVCCPTRSWTEAEENLAKELALQDIRVHTQDAADVSGDMSGSALVERAKTTGADAAVAIVRNEFDAAVNLAVISPVAPRLRFRILHINNVTQPDAAVACAVRAAEAMVAVFSEVPEPAAADGDKAPSERGSAPPTFTTIAPPDGFAEPEKATPEGDDAAPQDDQPVDDISSTDAAKAPVKENPTNPAGPASTEDENQAPDAAADAERESRQGTSQARFSMSAGGAFAFSSREAGVRSGFGVGAGLRFFKGAFATVEGRMLPFGPEISDREDTSAIRLYALRGWLGWRFREGARVRPAVRVGAGGWFVVAEGIPQGIDGVGVKDDTTRVAAISLGTSVRIDLAAKVALQAGAAVGMMMPEVTLSHRSGTVAELGRPLVDWSVDIVVDIF